MYQENILIISVCLSPVTEEEGLLGYEAIRSNSVNSENLKRAQESQRTAFATSQQQRILAATAQMQRLQAGQSLTEKSTSDGVAPVIGEQYLVFLLNNREIAVKADHIQGVERPMYVTPVPNVVSWVRGVVNLRGSVASVVDLREFLGLEQSVSSSRTRLLSLQANEMIVCILVDSVSEMLQIPQAAVGQGDVRPTTIPQWIAPYAEKYAQLDDRIIVLLDVARLLFSDKMQRY